MVRKIQILFLLCLFFTSCTPGGNNTAAPTRSIELEKCALPTPSGQQIDALCGTLSVPEDRDNPAGRQIALNIALIPAIKRKPEPDPLFLLAGGPGQSATETFPMFVSMLYTIHQARDIVLVDQRGTGKSNPLRCLDQGDESLTEEQVLTQLKTCHERLDADVRFYTTEIAMQDLDDVRAALGYEIINIYGASYGTRAGLTYLRMFPDRVRTLTLDSVVDSKFVMFMDAAQDGQHALDLFFTRCEADPACATAFPDLKMELNAVLEQVDASPKKITVPDPVTNQPLDLTVTRKMLTGVIFNTLYSSDLVSTLPLAIHTAYSSQDYQPLITQAIMLDAGLFDGMFYAVTCTEDAPLIQPATAAQNSQASLFGDRTIEFGSICAEWPRGKVSSEFRSPVQSDIPVLILSGEADPITPPWHAQKVAASLSNSLHLEFKGFGHGNLNNLCSVNILKDFVDTATLTDLDTSCVAEITPPPFFINFNGPKP